MTDQAARGDQGTRVQATRLPSSRCAQTTSGQEPERLARVHRRTRSNVAAVLAAVAVAVSVVVAAAAADWPVYQHDHRRSGVTTESLDVAGLQSQWVYRAASRPVPAWGAPAKWDAYAGIRGLKSMRNYDPVFHNVVAGGRVYFGSSADDSVRCLDARSGAVLWTITVDAPVRLAPTYADGRVYFGADDGNAYCVAADTGREIWRFGPAPEDSLVLHDGRFISFWPCRTGVLVDEGTAYFAMGMLPWKETYLCAVDALTGKPEGPGRFVRRLEDVTLEGALLASRQRLICPQGRIPPLLFNRADGAPLGLLEGGGGSFVLLTEDAHVLHGPGNKTGWVQESREAERTKVATFEGATMMVVRGDLAFAQTDTEVMAINRSTRRTLWKRTSAYPHALVLAYDTLIAGGTDGVGAFRASDGSTLWEAKVEGRAFGLAVADGGLFVSTDEGLLYCFRAGEARRGEGEPPPTRAAATVAPVVPAAAVEPVEPFQDPALLGRWVFRPDQVRNGVVQNLAGGTGAALLGEPRFVPVAGRPVWELDGATRSALITGDLTVPELPVAAMSAEAWVRVDQPQAWGGLVGALQDNGDFERGWLLGFVNSKFAFALAGREGPQRLTYLSAGADFEKGRWYHVVGTYDGATMRLYVNGRLENESAAQRGPIHYPSDGFYEIGAYHDKDEYYRTSGALREVRVYRRALTADEAKQHAAGLESILPDRLRLKAGPMLTFAAGGQASVWWETTAPAPTRLQWGLSGGPYELIEEAAPKTEHRAILAGLRHDRRYEYIIQAPRDGRMRETEAFECDTYFDYSLAPAGARGPSGAASVADPGSIRRAEEILAEAGLRTGLVLLLGAGNTALAQALVERSELRVQLVDTDADRVKASRATLLAAQVYGSRVAARHVASWDALPFRGAFANLVLASPEWGADRFPADPQHLLAQVRPYGGLALVGLADAPETASGRETWARWKAAADRMTGMRSELRGRWMRFVRDGVPGAGEWTHQYGTAANTAYGGESLQGASSAADLEVQWLGAPGPRAQADRNGRKPAPLASHGRLFVQGLHRIAALDGYNGGVLWARELPTFERFNLPRDCSNWCADRDHLYTAMGSECWRFVAQTGELAGRQAVVPGARHDWRYEWGFLSAEAGQLIGSAVKEGAPFTEFWGGADAGWYDATSGPATFKVASDNLFALDTVTGERRWVYTNGLILNCTITILDQEIYLIEARHPAVRSADTRRLGQPGLWRDLWLVALDRAKGTPRWERRIQPAPGEVMLCLAAAKDRLVLVSSGGKRYHVYAFDRSDGAARWERDFPWLKDNHGGHMARPAIVGDTVFVRPQVFELSSGTLRPQAVPGGGCGTYAATDRALIFRDSNVTLWDSANGRVSSWSRLRPDCWLSTIPASGLLLSPEAGGGCSCGTWLEASIVFRPALAR